MFVNIRKKKAFRIVAAYLALSMLAQIFAPTVAMALTNGPSQPEFQSFEPAGTSDMVDMFSGDFTYNIPLFDLPGPDGSYPFNLAYHSGISMEQEASWVGTGWNINPGAINRDKRGLPDDFNGDPIKTELDMKPDETYGGSIGVNLELWGGDASASGSSSSGGSSGSSGSLGISITIYNNSYKGMGYSFDPSISMSSEGGAGLGLGLSLDSQEGVGASADASYEKTTGNKKEGTTKSSVGVGVGFNSQRGLNVSFSGGYSKTRGHDKAKIKDKKDVKGKARNMGGSSTYSFSEQAFTPAFSTSMEGRNLQIALKLGGDFVGILADISIAGFYRETHIKNLTNEYQAYGYNYLENADDGSLMDFNREKDGTIRKETPNLPSPVLTNDTYMAYGQGFMGNYRAHRSDVGHLHDPFVESRIWGGSIGVDLGFGVPTFHLGVAASFNNTVMNSGDWEEDNNWTNNPGVEDYNYKSSSSVAYHNYENIYYKVKGEPTSYDPTEMNFVGGQTAVRANLEKSGSKYNPQDGILVFPSGAEKLVTTNVRDYSTQGRNRRDNSIQPITNELLLNSSTELLGEYKIKYHNSINLTNYHYTPAVTYNDRTPANRKPHTAGFSCINPEGMRYVYALPAYNKKEIEQAFSIFGDPYFEEQNYIPSVTAGAYHVTNTDEFNSRTETPEYAHSYLLTSVLGADYVDLTGDGPTDDDYGYWVKFNYVKTSSNYNWRTPYSGALYMRGMNNKGSDDKAMFNSGEKEIWMLASSETKSHIAVFKLSERKDGVEADPGFNGGFGAGTNKSYKLDEINLFSKEEYNTASPLIPLKTVHFDYTYDLCGGVVNNDGTATGTQYYSGIDRNANRGKLTLKKVWFTYQKNTRGELSPYTFDYNERVTPGGAINTAENPAYNPDNYDRWGSYTDSGSDFFKSKNFPYTSQFVPDPTGAVVQDQATKNAFKTTVDRNAAVWNLKKIDLPTGGSIQVDYEADDYAYVQHRQATQMFQILRMADPIEPSKVYGTFDHLIPSQRQVFFKLENPIPTASASPGQKLYDDYLAALRQEDGSLQMYFRIKSNLRDGIFENVVGYSKLESSSTDYGVDPSSIQSIDGIPCYTAGFVTLQLFDGNNTAISDNGPIKYHPFAVAAWQYMRINQPELLTATGTLSGSASPSAMDKAMKVKSLLSVFPAMMTTFTGYRRYASNHLWGKNIDLEKSFIRLGTPDKVKYGGGLRVKKITYNDNWATVSPNEISNSYGQVYNYTTTEGTGAEAVTISSGVAQYEPLVGGDEIALRHAKTYPQHMPLFTDNNLFYEYPINESYFPGASVGYSKVTVQSIASKNSMPGGTADPTIPTTGVVEYQFYTAKEFPVITEETNADVFKYNLWIPIPLVGQINTNKLFGTQGYAITLNDMHGKLKSIKNYAKNINGEVVLNSPTSSVFYEYKCSYRNYDGQTVKVLENNVEAIINESIDKDLTSSTYNYVVCNKKNVIMGEEYEFFVDSRQSHVFSAQGGLSVNIEWTLPYITIPCPWPSISTNKKDLRTIVTNKVINKSGILISTTATDGQSEVKTENKLFDAQTGSPLLTVVTNDFNNPIYNYEHPGYWDYDNIGAAAQNFNYTFYANVRSLNTTNNTFNIFNDNASPSTEVTKNPHSPGLTSFPINENDFYNTVAEGDELIAETSGAKWKTTLIKKFTGYNASCGQVYSLEFHPSIGAMAVGNEVKLTIVRSGRRNMLTTNTGSIAALKDPTDNANRGLTTTSTTASSVTLGTEFALLLNNLLATSTSSPNQLPFMTVDFSNASYYDSNGDPIYPLLSSMFNYITIGGKISGCDYVAGQNPTYYIKCSYIKEDGTCVNVTCDCVAQWGVGTSTPPSPAQVYDLGGFTANPSTGVITVNYLTWNSFTPPLTQWDPAACINLTYPAKMTYIDDVISSSSVLERDYWDYDGLASVAIPPVSQTNLYSLGKKGIWKPYKNYYYKDDRVNQLLATDVKLSHDGVYKGTFPLKNEFYFFNWKPTLERPVPVAWMPNSLVCMYDQNSNAVQTRDIINIYSAVQYGYNGQLPIIQGNNVKKQEMLFEGFEDVTSPIYMSFSAPGPNNGFVPSSIVAHTGKKSFAVTGNTTILYLNNLILTGNAYTISLWVSQNTQAPTFANTGDDVGVKFVFYDATMTSLGTSVLPLRPSGNVIEKWQRMEGNIAPIPPGTVSVGLQFQTNLDGTGPVITNYFDDIRVFPTNSNVSTSVYDPNNFRIKAVLDANNYATFYNYDEEGKLFVVKKETTDGIKTIKEERGHIKE